ncbi:MAG: Unknown protein, partial [uncultured Aureispira sp.]
MLKFILQIAFLSILLLLGYWFIATKIVVPDNYYKGFSYNYMSGIKLKHQRAEEFKQPKILFVGGSSLAYGMDSELVENTFLVPVVNLGHHGGLGVSFMLNQAKKLLKKGDIVFISIEYFTGKGDYELIEKTCLEFPEVADLREFSIKQEIQLHLNQTREGLVKFVEGKQNKKISISQPKGWTAQAKKNYNPRREFNKYGDYTQHLGREGWYKRRSDESKFQYRYWEGIQLLNQFKASAKEKGADVFFIYPPLAKEVYDLHVTTINKVHKDLKNNLDFEVLNSPEDFVFDNSYFYDTHYH